MGSGDNFGLSLQTPPQFALTSFCNQQTAILAKHAWFKSVIIVGHFSWHTTPFILYSIHPKASSYHLSFFWIPSIIARVCGEELNFDPKPNHSSIKIISPKNLRVQSAYD